MERHRVHRPAQPAQRADLTAAAAPEAEPSRFIAVPAPTMIEPGALRRQPSAGTLTVGAADDPFEHAADRAADTALQRIRRDRSAPTGGASASASASTPVLIGREGGALDRSTESAIQAMRGRGAPLPAPVRSDMEQAFDTDLGALQVHTGPQAAELSHSISAKAFTVGNDVFFGAGAYRPDTADGQHTLAHEIAHTVQAGSAVHRIQRAYDLREKKPLGVDGTTAMTTVGDRQVWFLDDGESKVVVKLEDQPLGLNQLATQLHSRLTPTSTVTSRKLLASDRTAVRELISDATVTKGDGWSKAASGDIKKDQFNGDLSAWGRAVHLAKIDSVTDPMIVMTVADGKTAKALVDPSLSFEADGFAPIKKVLTEPKMLRQLGELTATDLFVGNADRVLSGNLGNWFYTPDREMTVIDNVDSKMTGHLNAAGARTGAVGPEVNEGDRDPLWRLASKQLPTTAATLLDAVSAAVTGQYLKTMTYSSGGTYEITDTAKKAAWAKWLKPLRPWIEAELVAGMKTGRKRIIKTMTSSKFSNRGKRGAKKEIKQQARAATQVDARDRGLAPDYYEILKGRASWLDSH